MKRKNKSSIVFILLFLVAGLLVFRINEPAHFHKGVDFEKEFVGKILNSVERVVESFHLDTRKLKTIVIYSGFDCSVCVRKSFSIIKTLKNKNINVYVVATSTNINRDQIRYHLRNVYIWEDKHDLIRKELKFIPTPVLVILNNKNKIVNGYVINLETDEREIAALVGKFIAQ